ncbi:MAG: SBBP repeat-containing protein [Spirochaetaceae bacterium]|nr:SBBP repeat-containing protein [Spirochaetaceae bacterium]
MTTRKNSILAAAFFIVFMALLAGCNNAFGVFHEIQTEKPQEGTDTFYEVNVKAIVEDASNYYAAMAKVFYRPTSGNAGDIWKLLKVNGTENYFCSGIAADSSGNIYVASSAATDGRLNGVYMTADQGSTWSDLITTADPIATKIVDALFMANDTLFACAHTLDINDNQFYGLYYYDSGSKAFVLAGSNLNDMKNEAIVNVQWDGSRSEYWAISHAKAFKGTAGSMAADTTSGTPVSDSDRSLQGLYIDSNNAVRISTYDDYLFTLSPGGSAWTSAAISEDGDQSSSIHLGAMIEVTGPSTETQPRLVIANSYSPYGYFEYKLDGSGNAIKGSSGFLAGGSSIYNSTVNYKPVITYYLSKDAKTLFIGLAACNTEAYGLYSTSFSATDDAWSGWTAE